MNKIKLQGSSFFIIRENDSASQYILLQHVSTETRRLSVINTAQVDSPHVHMVTMVKLEFDTPAYAHSGIGTISYGGADYLGVGNLGAISGARETEILGPSPISLTLSGADSDLLAEAVDSGNLYDRVTIYQGYRQDDGTLYDDPWVVWSGWFEYAAISVGEESAISVTCQHDLSMLSEKNGSRYSDEDQQNAYTGDVGLAFASDTNGLRLMWGGKNVGQYTIFGGDQPSNPGDSGEY